MYTEQPVRHRLWRQHGLSSAAWPGRSGRVLFSNADGSLTTKEDTSKRVNAPSNWSSTYSVGSNLTLDVVKFIHQENVAVTTMTLTNKSRRGSGNYGGSGLHLCDGPGKVTVNGAEQTG